MGETVVVRCGGGRRLGPGTGRQVRPNDTHGNGADSPRNTFWLYAPLDVGPGRDVGLALRRGSVIGRAATSTTRCPSHLHLSLLEASAGGDVAWGQISWGTIHASPVLQFVSIALPPRAHRRHGAANTHDGADGRAIDVPELLGRIFRHVRAPCPCLKHVAFHPTSWHVFLCVRALARHFAARAGGRAH